MKLKDFIYNKEAKECDYKHQWVDAGKPFRIPSAIAFGKEYMPLVFELDSNIK